MKRYREPLATLRRAPVLASIREAHFEGLVKVMEPGKLRVGQVLFRQGQPGELMAVVTRGFLAVSVIDEKGTRTVLGGLGPGDVVGELAVLDPAPRAATVTAMEPSEVYCFSRKQLLGLRHKGPAVAMAMVAGILTQVAQRIRRTNSLIEARLRALYGLPEAAARDAWAAGRDHRLTGAGKLINPRMIPGDVDLQAIPDLIALTPEDGEELKAVAHQILYPRGTVLCEESDWGESCYLIAEGRVDVFKAVDGKPRRLGTVGTCLLGQLALVDPAPRIATLRTATDVAVLELSRAAWEGVLARKSWFAMRFQDVVAAACARQLRRANERLAALPQAASAPAPVHVPAVPAPAAPPPDAAATTAPARPAGRPNRAASAATVADASKAKPPCRSPKEIVDQMLGLDGDAFTHVTERRAVRNAAPVEIPDEELLPKTPQRLRARPSTMRLARLQTTLLFGVDPKKR